MFKGKLVEKFFQGWLLLVVFLLPWQTRWILRANSLEYLSLSVYGVDLLLLGIILGNFQFPISNFQKNFKFQISNIKFKLFAAFFLWAALSVAWAPNKAVAGQWLGWGLLALGLGWVIYQYKNKLEVGLWFVCGLTLSAWLGIGQFVWQKAFANKWLGLAAHDPRLPGTSIVEIATAAGPPLRWLRAYGSFDHPNIFGAMSVVGIMLTLWLFQEKRESKRSQMFLGLILVSLTVGALMSLSRAALAGLFLGIAALMIRGRWSQIKKASGILGIVTVLTIALLPQPFLARSDWTARLEQKSFNERQVYFEQGVRIIKKNWLVGVGAGNYIPALKFLHPFNPPWSYQPVHNVFLLVWAELGFFAMVGLLWSLFWGLKFAWQNNPWLLAILVALIPSLLVDHWLGSLHGGILLVGFLSGFFFKQDEKTLAVVS